MVFMVFSLLDRNQSNLIDLKHAILRTSCAFTDRLNYTCNPQFNPIHTQGPKCVQCGGVQV